MKHAFNCLFEKQLSFSNFCQSSISRKSPAEHQNLLLLKLGQTCDQTLINDQTLHKITDCVILVLEVYFSTVPNQIYNCTQRKSIFFVQNDSYGQVQEFFGEFTCSNLRFVSCKAHHQRFVLFILDAPNSLGNFSFQFFKKDRATFFNLKHGPHQVDQVVQTHQLHLFKQLNFYLRKKVISFGCLRSIAKFLSRKNDEVCQNLRTNLMSSQRQFILDQLPTWVIW